MSPVTWCGLPTAVFIGAMTWRAHLNVVPALGPSLAVFCSPPPQLGHRSFEFMKIIRAARDLQSHYYRSLRR